MKKTGSKMMKKVGALCVALCMVVSLAAPAFAATETFRSEERRVGKEC